MVVEVPSRPDAHGRGHDAAEGAGVLPSGDARGGEGVADFVDRGSVVRRIWGDGDMVLLVFAGSAAEFALNRAVDWLFFTGRLPADPIGRLFSTASYAQGIVFADAATAARTLARIRSVHQAVERERGQRIPDWAHRDVLYMLIDYSERAHETFARPLTGEEKRELYDVFHRVGIGLGIPDLPPTYAEWRADRDLHLRRDLVHGEGTKALYAQYRKHLGPWRYHLLLRLQSILTPDHVRGLLRLRRAAWLRPLVRSYPILVRAGLRSVIQWVLMPSTYLAAVRGLDHLAPGPSGAAPLPGA
ncbi:MAG TPA: oxygenase MpaB family protein [Longimicrobium sp.]|nr:oxygenase MpaB family protein [Longimicrobium sp.]